MPTGLDSRLRGNDGLRGFKKMKETRPSEKRFSFVEAMLSDGLKTWKTANRKFAPHSHV